MLIDLGKCTDVPFCNLVQHWGRIVADDGLLLELAPEGYKADVDIVQKATGIQEAPLASSPACLCSQKENRTDDSKETLFGEEKLQ